MYVKRSGAECRMIKYNCLSALKPGECGVVSKIFGKNDIRRRLQDLGMVEGTRVMCLQRSPLGDPTAYLIRGAVIALRTEDSCNIFLQ